MDPATNLELCCPRCRSEVRRSAAAYACASCGERYPIVEGIPDFRIAPDPYIDLEGDRVKARHLAERARSLDLEGLVRHYFEITPEVPPALARKYARAVLETSPARARRWLSVLDAPEPGPNDGILEIGCGSGPFLPALAERATPVVGCDIALRWLVIARKRLDELGCELPLLGACAERLPFRDDAFGAAVAANVIEHVREPIDLVAELRRVLRPGGVCLLTTPNRFTLAPDSHLGVWGAGFLPRAWRDRYVRRVRGTPADRVRTRSFFELRALMLRGGFRGLRFLLPEIPRAELSALGRVGRLAGRIYNVARRRRSARPLLLLVGPFFAITARAPGGPDRLG